LIEQLTAKARQAGHFLPVIVPTHRFPGWAGLSPTESDRNRLLQAGGASALAAGGA